MSIRTEFRSVLGGKNMISEEGGGGKNIDFDAKYRPLYFTKAVPASSRYVFKQNKKNGSATPMIKVGCGFTID